MAERLFCYLLKDVGHLPTVEQIIHIFKHTLEDDLCVGHYKADTDPLYTGFVNLISDEVSEFVGPKVFSYLQLLDFQIEQESGEFGQALCVDKKINFLSIIEKIAF